MLRSRGRAFDLVGRSTNSSQRPHQGRERLFSSPRTISNIEEVRVVQIMKKWIILSAATIIAIYLGVIARNALWEVSHDLVLSSTTSPDGKYIARLYAFSDGGTPPFGNGVAISPADEKPGPYFSEEFVFKGDCDNPLLSWPSPTELKLKCTYVERVGLHTARAGNINFFLEDATPKPLQAH